MSTYYCEESPFPLPGTLGFSPLVPTRDWQEGDEGCWLGGRRPGRRHGYGEVPRHVPAQGISIPREDCSELCRGGYGRASTGPPPQPTPPSRTSAVPDPQGQNRQEPSPKLQETENGKEPKKANTGTTDRLLQLYVCDTASLA